MSASNTIKALKTLEKRIRQSSRYWQNNRNDPHGIATSIYVSHLEIANAIRAAREAIKPRAKGTK